MRDCDIEYFADMVIDNYHIEKDDDFYEEIKLIKDHGYIKDVTEKITNKLINLLNSVDEAVDRAIIIEAIAFFLGEYYDRYSEHFIDNIESLVDEYISIIPRYATNSNNASIFLQNIVYLGYDEETLITKLIININKKQLMPILLQYTCINENSLKEILKKYTEYDELIKLRERSFVISSFILIANEKSMKYDYVNRFNNLSLSFNNCDGMIEDYYWRIPKLLEDKIITKRESEIIIKLGEYLHKENISTVNYDENILSKIYDEFFEGKDPINTMLTLPNE